MYQPWKGLSKAFYEVFGGGVLVQRCQRHKRENVLSYLPKGMHGVMRRKLREACEEPSYDMVKEQLLRVRRDSEQIIHSPVNTLDKGFEETLNLHRFGLFQESGIGFKTTNCIESLMVLLAQKTDKVDYWRKRDQKHR